MINYKIMKNEIINFFRYPIGEHKFLILNYLNEEGADKYCLTEIGYGVIISDATWGDVKDRLDHYHDIFLKESKNEAKEYEGIPLEQALRILQ